VKETHIRGTRVVARDTLQVQAEITRDIARDVRARALRHFTMAPAPARSRVPANRAHDASVWTVRMVVRVTLITCALCVLPSLVRAAIACALGFAVFLAVTVACGVMISSFAWRELAHPAPATRFEPRPETCFLEASSSPSEMLVDRKNENGVPVPGASPVRTVAVIGGGAAGLATLRQMKRSGFHVTLFEKSDDIGGLWRFGKDTGKVFKNVLQNITKNHNRFAGCEPPEFWPPYLGHEKTLQYLSFFCERFKLKEDIRFNHDVKSITRVSDGRGGVCFEVSVERSSSSGENRGETETALGGADKSFKTKSSRGKNRPDAAFSLRFDAVAVCTGQLTGPIIPDDSVVPGLSTFPGRTLHTSEYRTSLEFANKKVLIVGMGSASGSDVAQDLRGVASETFLAARTQRPLLRRGITGGSRSCLTRLVSWLPSYLGLVTHLYADAIPFFHALARTPTATDSGDFLREAVLGHIKVRPRLKSVSGTCVFFEDGTTESNVDCVIFATGFRRRVVPCFDGGGGGGGDTETNPRARTSSLSPHELPGAYKGVLSASCPRLAFILFVLPFGSHFQVAELQAAWVAKVWSGELGTPEIEDMVAHAKPISRIASHDILGEYYRIVYARLLAPSLFCTENFYATFWKLFRSGGARYVDPVLEWVNEKKKCSATRAFDHEKVEESETRGVEVHFDRAMWTGWSYE